MPTSRRYSTPNGPGNLNLPPPEAVNEADIVYLVIVIPTVIYCFMWEVSEQDA